MNSAQLFDQIRKKKSFLCVGLDTDPAKIPPHLHDEADPVFSFNKAIIEATAAYAVAYKPNIAFYEAMGSKGWTALEKTIHFLKSKYPEVFTIADAKRGDIGNTSAAYARAFLQQLDFDAITVAPYMGEDSVKPFLGFADKWVILLALTSNSGSKDFQYLDAGSSGKKLYESVILTSSKWASHDQLMYVVGATHPDELAGIRRMIPDHFLLIPGIGAQGGDLARVAAAGMSAQCGILVNSSRGILYASSGTDFALRAAEEALELQSQMAQLLRAAKL
ncbi:MAG: orotidine-5'-phosphate decarboxylase [Bacteroidetes bacterium]|nr:orotidine-5'-phosphate decarboxylase [Bacteroidota bacterium]